jgi:hypothetical protein
MSILVDSGKLFNEVKKIDLENGERALNDWKVLIDNFEWWKN